ncbi:hypothetical protein PPYR_00547 [Photinus pyralis]|uniref:Uncharacterized protein n=2 Tax=Photinus pyralis TaxID=7054 RepID=A0A5N4B1V3_PHOPY|nr:A-kinase anchor protein 14-like [Photinus pyralis]KAB0803577.1 hypothetical protein PPYR_00547 [Photinus pyralis]
MSFQTDPDASEGDKEVYVETLQDNEPHSSESSLGSGIPPAPPCTPIELSECTEVDTNELLPNTLTEQTSDIVIDEIERRIRISEAAREISCSYISEALTDECILYSDIETFSGYFVDEIIETSIGRLIQEQDKLGITVIIEAARSTSHTNSALDSLWPRNGEFTKETGMDAIHEYLRTWIYVEDWLYCVDFLMVQSDECSEYYLYEAKFSIPTRCYPIPQATASVFFTVEVSRIKPLYCPVDISYVFEGSSLVRVPGKVPFDESFLFDIVDAKLSLYKSISF